VNFAFTEESIPFSFWWFLLPKMVNFTPFGVVVTTSSLVDPTGKSLPIRSLKDFEKSE
jgi:hypothetical protein